MRRTTRTMSIVTPNNYTPVDRFDSYINTTSKELQCTLRKWKTGWIYTLALPHHYNEADLQLASIEHDNAKLTFPFSILFPTKTPPLHLFKSFGCHAIILKPEAALLKKMQPRGLTGIYIGTTLPRGQSGYLI